MPILYLIISVLCFLASPAMGQSEVSSQPLTLSDCYRLTLKRSESLAIHSEEIKEAEGRFLQSFSTILPKVHFSYSEKRQDDSSGVRSLVPEQKFTFSQPLFTGFKEFAAIAGSRAEERRQKHEYRRAKELLFLDVVNAFYLVLGYQEEYQTLDAIRQTLLERIDELKKREDLGRSRPSESVSVQARLGRVEADLEFLQSEMEVAKELLEFLTGQKIDAITDSETLPQFSMSEDDISPMAQGREDVLAAKEVWEKSKKDVVVAQSGFWPEVSLDGNYYTKRVGTSADIDWDVTLTAEVPLFKGGENFGKFKEASAIANQEELRYQETGRLAVLDIRNASTRWERSLRRFEAVKKALEAAEKNYEMQKEEYKLNLVNNLEVLQVLEETEDMRRSFINIKNETKRDYWQLKIALGKIDEVNDL